MADAIVLAGALMKGPFAAGALAVLSAPAVRARLGINIRRIVAASSGALSAAYYAHAIHVDEEADAGSRLSKLWIGRATLAGSIAPSLRAISARRGFSSAAKLRAILREKVRPAPARRPIELRLVVTNADGERSFVGGARATSHEHVFGFDGGDFATEEGLERMFDVVAASAAFPGLFEPVVLSAGARRIQCIDGGATDNAPLRAALEGAPEVTRVFVISPTPRVMGAPASLHGLSYVSRLAEILIEERLVRDLRDCEQTNDALAALEEAVPEVDCRRRVLGALGWSSRRRVQVIEIRPRHELEGNAFSGWFSRRLRKDYACAGVAAAQHALTPLAEAMAESHEDASTPPAS
jgi:NTE family protein